MKYTKPENVKSPKNVVKVLEIIHDGKENSFSIAKLKWNKSDCFGIRWNISNREKKNKSKKSGEITCKGMPTSFGNPVWFILPDEFRDYIANHNFKK